jgi:beta-lactamase regulating signal transducer with metallopeptidase domain
MDAALNWLWQGCIVALALVVMLRLLERARANVRYVVCWVALLLILVLPALSWLGTNTPQPDALSSITANAIVSVPYAWWTSSAVMSAAWMVWASAYIVRFVWAMIALRRERARSRPFPTKAESVLCHWRHVRGGGRRAELVLSDSVPAAAVLGCGRPMIAVSPSLVTTLDADELDRVLIHEWAHVQRRDDLVNILQIVIRIVAGFHPAVWWIERRLHVEREISCDEMVVAVTGSPKSYAECLVKLASVRGARPTALAGPAVLAASGLRVRVTRIVSRRAFIAHSSSRRIATGIVVALCLVSVAVGGLRLVDVTALALPFESIRKVEARFSAIAPAAVPTAALQRLDPPRSRRHSGASLQSARRPIAEDRAPVPSATPGPEATITSAAPTTLESTAPHATAERGAETSVVPEPSAEANGSPTEISDVPLEADRSLWTEAADRGIAIGRKSKDAGVATGGLFTRFARRVARSF